MKSEPTWGWGRFPVIPSVVHRARFLSDLQHLAASPGPLLAQGRLRSYGDAALASSVVSTLPLRHLLLLHLLLQLVQPLLQLVMPLPKRKTALMLS